MNLRWKIALSLAAIALVATSAVGLISYRSTSARLVSELDRSISSAAEQIVGRAVDTQQRDLVPTRDLLDVYRIRLINTAGDVVASSFPSEPALTATQTGLLGDRGDTSWSSIEMADGAYRVYSIGVRNGMVQVARSMEEVDRVLDDVRKRTIVLVVLVSIAAAGVGWLIAGTVSAPIRRLTKAAEDVETSGRLDVPVPGAGSDEVGRLGSAFAKMLDALSRSRAEQQRLVQDAGHELRTPLTSLRTNLAVLRRHPEMDDGMRGAILDDLDTEVNELTTLVNELVAVASGDLDDQPIESLDLTALTIDVAQRVGRRRSRDVHVIAAGSAWIDGPRAGLDRAIANLVDNACKFDTSGGPIEVRLQESGGSITLTVLDNGPGIPDDQLDKVFERFHRAATSRTMPGSGLGLSIVREVIDRVGGTVSAANRPEGGCAIGFTIPCPPAPGDPSAVW